ncbi:MAG: glycosyltransferase family 39 protein [Candidatus Bathyarchaeia archaeon]
MRGDGLTYWYALLALLGVNVLLHLFLVRFPSYPVFDEFYYVGAARSILFLGPDLRPEHPPLAQLIIASGIALLGDIPAGWRIFSILFGVFTILVVYLLVRDASGNEGLAFAAAFAVSFENLFFTFSLLGLLDIFFVFFLSLSIYLQFKRRHALSGVVFAFSVLSKLSAVVAFPLFPIFFLLRKRFSIRRCENEKGNHSWTGLLVWLGFFFGAFAVFGFIFDQIYGGLLIPNLVGFGTVQLPIDRAIYANPLDHLSYIISAHSSTDWPQRTEPPPWLWLVTSRSYYLGTLSLAKDIFLEGFNPLIMGMAFLSIPLAVYNYIRNRESFLILIFLWFSATYLVWIGVYLLFARPLFFFYLVPTIPAIAIANVMFLSRNKTILWVYLGTLLAYFLIFQYPLRAAFPIP